MDADNATTKPTIETVLERINALGESLHGEIKSVRGDIERIDKRLDKFDERFDDVDERLDQIEALTNKTRSEFLNMGSDFRQWRDQLKEILPQTP